MRFVAWLLPSLCFCGLCAWLSVNVQQAGFAPLGLHSIAVGVGVASGLLGLAVLARLPFGHTVRMTACLLAFHTALLQHVAGYMQYRASFHRVVSSEPRASWAAAAGQLRPADFAPYLRARISTYHLMLWGLDTVLITLGGSVTFWLGSARLATPASPERATESAGAGPPADGGRGHTGGASSPRGR